MASVTETVFCLSSSESRMVKATPDSCWTGWADWWALVGSIDWKLGEVSLRCYNDNNNKESKTYS